MRQLFITAFFLLLHLGLTAQETVDRKTLNEARPKYLEIALHGGPSYFRDLATSPIFFRGPALGFGLHYHRFDSLKESRFGLAFTTGRYRFTIGNERASSRLQNIQLDFSKLYRIDRFSSEKYQLKLGGLAMADLNLRVDPALQNAGFGYEFIYNLMASAKVSRDLSRTTTKSGKFLGFIGYNWQPRKRLISYQLSAGLYNANVRNGYAYVNQEALLNEFSLFADYQHHLFQGFRISSALRYTIYLNNDNALRFSYCWDAYTTGGENDQFEIANHLFGAALLFDLSNW